MRVWTFLCASTTMACKPCRITGFTGVLPGAFEESSRQHDQAVKAVRGARPGWIDQRHRGARCGEVTDGSPIPKVCRGLQDVRDLICAMEHHLHLTVAQSGGRAKAGIALKPRQAVSRFAIERSEFTRHQNPPVVLNGERA